MNLMKAAEILIEKIKKDYRDDVSVVIMMGSGIYGATHAKSDLDMYFVPKTERGFALGKVCIIDGIGFDFWALSWERLARITAHEERITSIVTEGRVLYYGSEEDKVRFDALREQALDTRDRLKCARRAKEQLKNVYGDYFKLSMAETLYDARMCAICILYTLGHVIALLNGETVKRGRGKLKAELAAMPLTPESFEGWYDTLFNTEDLAAIQRDCRRLIDGTARLVETELEKREGARTFREGMEFIFEEMINFYNKIEHAVEIGDSVTALFAAVELQYEFEACFARTGVSARALPDIVSAWHPGDLNELRETALQHQQAVRALLAQHEVPVCTFRDFEALEAYYTNA